MDGGQTWTSVLDATTQAVIDAGATGFSKVMVSLAPTASPPNPSGQVLYAALLVGGKAKFFQNTNGGAPANWSQKNAVVVGPASFGPFVGGPFSDMIVDPASPGDGVNDRILYGGETQWLSKDSGDTFSEIGQIHGTHGDHQTFLAVPQAGSPSILYIGDDGGIFKSTDEGATWTGTSEPGSPATINAGGLQIGTFYALSVKQDATASQTLGGMQDSGRGHATGTVTWTGTSNDGIDVIFDKLSVDTAYSLENCGPVDCLLKSTNSGGIFTDVTPGTIPASERGLFQNRLAVDPNNAGYLYFGGSNGSVFRSLDAAGSFQSMGQPAPGQYVASLDVAPGDSNRLVIAANRFTGTDPASAVPHRVFVTVDALDATPTFDNLTDGLPTRFITRVAFDPTDPDVIYATLAGFGATTAVPGHVFRRTLGDAGWTDISPPVDVPVNALALDGTSVPTILYVGTDLGVLRSVDGGSSWEVVDDIHLPNAAVSDLDLNLTAGVLRAATWGRGVFELAAAEGPVIAVAQAELAFGETCPAGGADRTIDVSNVGTQPLLIQSVTHLSGSPAFTVLPSPATPLTLPPGGQAAFTVHFVPTTPGVTESAFIRIATNDPLAPFVDLLASGTLETQPPVISSLTATPDSLLPPNHKMRNVVLNVAVTDNCDTAIAESCRIVSVTSNEPVEGTGDGDTAPDWEITGDLTARLRAERAGSGPGRIYTITVECTDSAGNAASRTSTVTVPHN
jgi:HYDIN/CFA65/VesB-like, Ig-like domain